MNGERVRQLVSRHGLVAIATALAVGSVVHARAVLWSIDGLPAWDAAGYMLRAQKMANSMLALDLGRLTRLLLAPDLHPPLHSFLLASWMCVFGDDIAIARQFPTVLFAAGCVLLVWIGRLLDDQDRGTAAGIVAAAATCLSIEDVRYATTPMTESTAFAFQMLALAVALRNVPRRDGWSQLQVGIAVLLAGLTRYNLVPMLLVPLYGAHLLRHARERRSLLDPRVLLWVAPTVVVGATWQLLRPDLAHDIAKFLTNRSSGLAFWSVENLFWVPITIHKAYVGVPWLSIPLGLAFLLGLPGALRGRPVHLGPVELPGSQGLRLVCLFLLFGFAAITWHDYKIDRTLHALVPLVWLVAALALARLPLGRRVAPWAPTAAVALVGLPWFLVQHTGPIHALAERGGFRPEPAIARALSFIEQHARRRKTVWVTGWVFRLSPNLIEYWLRAHGVDGRIRLEAPLQKEKTRTGIDAGWDEAYADYVRDVMFAPQLLDDTTYITIETEPGSRYYDGWMAFGNNYVRAFEEQEIVGEVDRMQFIDEGLTLRVYRTNEEPSDATVQAARTAPTPADDAGIRLPPGTPFFREPFSHGAPRWRILPPAASSKVTVRRSGSSVQVAIPTALPRLQLCGPSPAIPAGEAFQGVLNLELRDITGRPWFHFRGLDDALGLLTTPEGRPDIVQVGPLVGQGPQVFRRRIDLGPGATHARLCAILDGVTGTFGLEDLALYGPPGWRSPEDSARLEPAAVMAVASSQRASGILFRDRFEADEGRWKVLPLAAARAVQVRADTGRLVIELNAPAPDAEVCGPLFDVAAPFEASATLIPVDLSGGASLVFRGLDQDGELAHRPGGEDDVVRIGPASGPGPVTLRGLVRPGPDSVRSRACLALGAGTTGTLYVDQVVARRPGW